MNTPKITEKEKQMVTRFMDERTNFLENWYNGTIDREKINIFANKLDEKWILVNKNTPNVINDKKTFLEEYPSMYGRYSENPVILDYDIQKMQKVSGEKILLTFFENMVQENEDRSRPISAILILDKETEEVKVSYIHA